MLPLLLSVVVSQAVPVGPPATSQPSPWGAPLSWTEGGRAKQGWVDPLLVAEPKPTPEGAAAVRRVDGEAVVVAERASMRLWRVKDAAAVRRAAPSVLPVVHDLPSTASRARVPVGLLCAGVRVEVAGFPALERAAKDPQCTPDFWTEGHAR